MARYVHLCFEFVTLARILRSCTGVSTGTRYCGLAKSQRGIQLAHPGKSLMEFEGLACHLQKPRCLASTKLASEAPYSLSGRLAQPKPSKYEAAAISSFIYSTSEGDGGHDMGLGSHRRLVCLPYAPCSSLLSTGPASVWNTMCIHGPECLAWTIPASFC